MYAYFKKLDYFCTECIYAPFAARGLAREFVKDLEVGPQGAGRQWRRSACRAQCGSGPAGAMPCVRTTQMLVPPAYTPAHAPPPSPHPTLQAARPRAILDLIRSAEQFRVPGAGSGVPQQRPGACTSCGYLSSQVRGMVQAGLAKLRCLRSFRSSPP